MWSRFSDFVLGERLKTHAPERMRLAIAEKQSGSEILIGWVQLALVLFFATLYTIAPKTSAGTGFTPVPWALGLYLMFTTVRIVLAYRRWLPRWFLSLSVIMDVTLLMVLIWSFHLQYEQPPSFYLKTPTVLYVFIFISLRALRFQAGYILLSGLIAALGWLTLVAYVIYSAGGGPMITRNYVTYMTSNSILIGAEIDKIVSILLVTIILVVAVTRAQRFLEKSIVESETARDLSRFVAPEIADRITTDDNQIEAGDGEVKHATVMFTDIEGFSGIAEKLTPPELMKTLNEYFSTVSEVIDREGGVITQYQGDSILVTFNTVKPDPDHAASAIRTAIGIQQVVAHRTFGNGVTMKTRCGINTGDIIAGAVGTKDRLLFTVHGDEVNIAARLEQLNKEYGSYILTTQNTVRLCGDAFVFSHKGETTVRGHSKPVALYTPDT